MGNLGEPFEPLARWHRPTARRAGLRCAVAVLLFGATTPLAAELADDLGAFRLAGLLHLGAALVLAPPVVWRGWVARLSRPPGPSRRRSWARRARSWGGRRPLVVAVVAGGSVGPVLLAAGLARTSSAVLASLLLNLELVATTVLAAALFREPVARRVATGTALVAVAGAGLVWSAPLPWAGALLVVAACGCRAVDNCATALLDGVTPQQVALAKGGLAGAFNLAVGLVATGLPGAGAALAALAVGAAGYGVSITLWLPAARDLVPGRAQLVFASAPFLGAVVAWTAFTQPVGGGQVAAGALAALGVVLAAGAPAERSEPRYEAFDPADEPFADDVEGAGRYGYLDEYDELFDEGLVPARRVS